MVDDLSLMCYDGEIQLSSKILGHLEYFNGLSLDNGEKLRLPNIIKKQHLVLVQNYLLHYSTESELIEIPPPLGYSIKHHLNLFDYHFMNSNFPELFIELNSHIIVDLFDFIQTLHYLGVSRLLSLAIIWFVELIQYFTPTDIENIFLKQS
jgi:hypothetical protein